MSVADQAVEGRKRIDWERIEPDWRAGRKSVLQIAADYETETGTKVSHTAINKHFKTLGVPRDLSQKVRDKADALVSAAMVSGMVSTETNLADSKIIETNAVVVANVQLSQRKDIIRGRALCMSMLAELEAESDNPELFAQIGELLAAPDEKGVDKLNEAYRKAISLPQRIDGVKKLAETLKILVGLERQAFGISDNAEGDKPQEPLKEMTANEAARRVAFLLMSQVKETK